MSASSVPTPDSECTARNARDAGLLAKLAAGDTSALDALVQLYTQTLFDAAMTVTATPDLAQDAAQDTWIWLWDHRDRLEVRTGLLPYLVRAVRHRAQSLIRREHAQQRVAVRRQAFSPDGQPEIIPAPDTKLHNAERRAVLAQALASLPTRAREILLLRTDVGLSYAEIADVLGVSISTVNTHIYRATKVLAERLGPWKDLFAGS